VNGFSGAAKWGLAALLAAFSFMFLLFGLLLVFTGVQLFRHRDEDTDIDDNVVVKTVRRLLPFSDRYDGGRLRTFEDGRRVRAGRPIGDLMPPAVESYIAKHHLYRGGEKGADES